LYAASGAHGINDEALLNVYKDYSSRYSDFLERCPVNHDEIDYFHRLYRRTLKRMDLSRKRRFMIRAGILRVWIQTYFKRGFISYVLVRPGSILNFESKALNDLFGPNRDILE
jgi:hypothetical protein